MSVFFSRSLLFSFSSPFNLLAVSAALPSSCFCCTFFLTSMSASFWTDFASRYFQRTRLDPSVRSGCVCILPCLVSLSVFSSALINFHIYCSFRNLLLRSCLSLTLPIWPFFFVHFFRWCLSLTALRSFFHYLATVGFAEVFI